MNQNALDNSQPSINSVFLSCVAVAICSFGGALIGLISSHFPSKNLAAVGAFYLVIAVFSYFSKKTKNADSKPHNLSLHTSGVDNLVAEAVTDRQLAERSTANSLNSVSNVR